jgi:hypothetical protein
MLNQEHQSTPYPEQNRYQQQEEVAPVMRFADWLVIMLIMLIPFLNGIMLIAWSIDKNANPNRRNWALASLFFMGIQFVLFMVILGTFMGTIVHAFSNIQSMGTW